LAEPDLIVDPADTPEARQTFAALYQRLRTGVLRGDLAPGSLVSQVQLAREYNISRGPLREALRMLQSEGLIEAEPRRRSRIANVCAPDVEQLYALRILVEALGVRLTVPRMDDAGLAELRRLLDEMDEFGARREFDQWEVPHRLFHRALVAHGGERLLTTVNELSDHAERYRRILLAEPRAWSSVAMEHSEIVEACDAGDVGGAASRLADHYARTALTVCASLAPDYEPAGVREALRFVRAASGAM
jgi:DNA-binding GntR family transcriptional regulator